MYHLLGCGFVFNHLPVFDMIIMLIFLSLEFHCNNIQKPTHNQKDNRFHICVIAFMMKMLN